jgi:hypothetical protein
MSVISKNSALIHLNVSNMWLFHKKKGSKFTWITFPILRRFSSNTIWAKREIIVFASHDQSIISHPLPIRITISKSFSLERMSLLTISWSWNHRLPEPSLDQRRWICRILFTDRRPKSESASIDSTLRIHVNLFSQVTSQCRIRPDIFLWSNESLVFLKTHRWLMLFNEIGDRGRRIW